MSRRAVAVFCGVALSGAVALSGCTASTPEPSSGTSSTAAGPTAVDSTATGATATGSTATGATAAGPTAAGPTVVDSTATSSTAADSSDAGSATTGAAGCEWSPCYQTPTAESAQIVGAAPEASGLAADSTDPDLFYTVDDGTGASSITAVRSEGTVVGQIGVDGMSAANAEAVAAGVCDAGSAARCLYVGDIGGNAGRDSVVIYRIAEPGAGAVGTSVPAQAWTYDYPDGTYNAEALLISDAGSVLVITKPDQGIEPHRVYVGSPGGGTLTLSSTFVPPVPRYPLQSSTVGNVVTDAARSADRVLLLTYDQAVEYLAPAPGADPAGFAGWPFRQLAIPTQWQSEGVSYRDAGGCGFVVISEKSPFAGPAIGSVECS